MFDRFRHDLLASWAYVITDRPWWIVGAAIAMSVVCAVYALTCLRFEPDRNALISERLEWNQRYIGYHREFDRSDLRVVVKAPQADGQVAEGGDVAARRFVDALRDRLVGHRLIKAVHAGFDADEAGPATLRLLPMPEFERRLGQLEQATPIITSESVASLIAQLSGDLARQAGVGNPNTSDPKGGPHDAAIARQAKQFVDLIKIVRRGIDGESPDFAALGAPQPNEHQYFASENGKLLFLSVEPDRSSNGEIDVIAPVVAEVRAAIAETQQALPAPHIEAGVTGIEVIEADETVVTTADATIASIVSVLVISILLIIAFHGWQMPVLAVASLLCGIAWTFGFLTLAIGHLQLLSVVFTVILLGLGIDFGVHIICQFELLRPQHASGLAGFRETMQHTMQQSGPGIITGAVTTALAFGTTLLTDFKGVGEMGLIAAVGLLLCLVAMLGVFPAAIRIARNRRGHVRPVAKRPVNLYEHHWWDPFARNPRWTLPAGLALLAMLAIGCIHLKYDDNLFDLLPDGVDSVYWKTQVQQHSGQSIFEATSVVDDLDEGRRLVEAYRKLPSVEKLGGVGLLFPRDEGPKLERLRAVKVTMEAALASQPIEEATLRDTPATLRAQLAGLGQMLSFAMASGRIPAGPGAAGGDIAKSVAELKGQIDAAVATLTSLDADVAKTRVDVLHTAFIAWRNAMRQAITDALDERALTPNDLPESVRREMTSVTTPTRYAVHVYPRQDVSVPADRARFIEDLRKVDPNVTGTIVQFYESSTLIRQAYIAAGVYALIAVFVILWFDFRKLTDTLLCILPVVLAFGGLFGVMGWTGTAVNPANIIVFPLMFGMGVDAGVHMLHRYRVAPTERPLGLTGGTGKGIMLTTLTTMIGFASLMLARHRGIASLGFTLTVGIALTLLVCLMMMPALLELRTRRRHRRAKPGDKALPSE